jgi:hypothetical protein
MMDELHFYPGIEVLAIYKENKSTKKFQVTRKFHAVGGPEFGGTDPRMPQEPTTPGRYVIHSMHPYRTPTWVYSKIKWGTPIKEVKNDIWYQLTNGKWGSVQKDTGLTKKVVMAEYFRLYKKAGVPKSWVFNDFGPIAIRYFKDLNNNRTLDKNESLSGQMIHTTSDNEAEYAQGKKVDLKNSHGCIHIRPQDRDTITALGLFKKGSTFVVHRYDERI